MAKGLRGGRLGYSREIVLLQPVVPEYRRSFLDTLGKKINEAGDRLTLIIGSEPFELGMEESSMHDLHIDIVQTRTFELMGGRFEFQPRAVRRLVAADVTVLPGNARFVTTWAVLLARRLMRRPTLVWGHAWPRSGTRGFRTMPLTALRRLSSGQLTYTQNDAAELTERFSWLKAQVVPNSLYSRDFLIPPPYGPDVVYVGRLVREKKVDLLLSAFAEFRRNNPGAGQLKIVGSGPELDTLRRHTLELGIEEHTRFLGKVTDVSRLREIYEGTFCSASPGYVGLSATQSLGFGRPLIFPDEDRHAPEVSLVRERYGLVFRANSAVDMARAFGAAFCQRQEWAAMSDVMCEMMRSNYSTEAMADSFCTAISGAAT